MYIFNIKDITKNIKNMTKNSNIKICEDDVSLVLKDSKYDQQQFIDNARCILDFIVVRINVAMYRKLESITIPVEVYVNPGDITDAKYVYRMAMLVTICLIRADYKIVINDNCSILLYI